MNETRRAREIHSLNLSQRVDHEGDELDAAEASDLVLGLEAAEEESEQLSDETG